MWVDLWVANREMARRIDRLSSVALRSKGAGLHADGRGLYFQVRGHSRSWILRFMLNGRARYMGLGPFPDVSLADARREAERCRKLLRDGKDPIEARHRHRQAARLEAAKAMTFQDCAERYIEDRKAGWRNAKHSAQWTSTLETYAYPVFGALPVQSIDTGLVTKALRPIWREKPETATRVRQRIEAVLDWATVHNYREGVNPARWRGHLEKVLPRRSKVQAVRHHEAMPYADLPEFFVELSKRDTVSAKALTFTILTAVRSGEVRHAAWSEIDRDAEVWTIPAERTKSGREHRVPLTSEALAILNRLEGQRENQDEFLFPNARGNPLSDTAMRKYLQDDMGHKGTTVHGFRSTFRDWAAERTNFPREVAEAALAHVLKDKAEAAYQRGDMLDRRRKLMDAWAKYCVSGERAVGQLFPMRGAS